MTLNYQFFDGGSSATRKTSKQVALEPFSLSKVVEEVVDIYEKRLFSRNERVLRKSISHDAGVNLGLFSINEHHLSSFQDFLELDLSQRRPVVYMLLDSRVYTQI